MSAQDVAELKAAMDAVKLQLKWMSWGVLVLSAIHGPEIFKLIVSGP